MWMVAPSYQHGTIKEVDEVNRKARVILPCSRCGGSGNYGPYMVDQGKCFACRGSGKIGKWVKAYTEEEYEKYIEQQEKAKEKKAEAVAQRVAELQANSESNRVAALEAAGYDSSSPLVWLVGGENTYNIKDWLKEHGFKFCPELTWYTTHEVEVPEGYKMISIPFEEVYDWDWLNKRFYLKEDAKTWAAAALESLRPESHSEWVGDIKERLRDLHVILTNFRTFEGPYGTSFIYTFKDGENVLTWFTTSCKDVEVGDEVLLTGTVKEHTCYNGEKQTKLSRCIIKGVG